MRKSNWTPSIIPNGNDQTVYLVADDFGKPGRAWAEAITKPPTWRSSSMTSLRGSTATRSGSSHSTLSNTGRKTSPKMYPRTASALLSPGP